MASNTATDVEDVISKSLAWRRIELHALKSAIAEAERKYPDAPLTRALGRSGVALLYAHWEGFVKDACQAYINYVAKKRLRLADLNDGLLRTALIDIARRAVSKDERGLATLVDAVRNPATRVTLPKRNMVNTRSNLRFEVLIEIFQSLGFPTVGFEMKGPLINSTLCDGRNSIAHGRDQYPSPGSFADLHGEVLGMMLEVQSIIRECIRTNRYKS